MTEPLLSFAIADGMICFRVFDWGSTTADDFCMEAVWDGEKWLLSIVRDRGTPRWAAACPAPIIDLELPLPEPLDREPWVLANAVRSSQQREMAGLSPVGNNSAAVPGLN